ncbi:MAG: LysM peptidoglycan-binding domain-containing protein, partial [Pseudomonadota bacterium]
LILPSGVAGQAPAIVQPEAQQLALLQSPAGDVAGVRLDRISYAAGGFVDLLGRAGPGNTVRIYVNAELAGQAVTVSAGQWRVILPGSRMRDAVLLRFDEISADGKVLSRIETPFIYERTAGPKTLGKQSVEIEKGDYLWRIAEQYYGEGIRYSLIFSANSGLIKDPDLIYPGQVFTLPALVDSE